MGFFGIGCRLFSGFSRLAFQPVHGAAEIFNQTRSISLTAALSNVRCHFPRPNEIKRIKRHGWKTRLSTTNGRKILMRRILKNRHVLSH
ncbi:39S ribosomal protein L34 [Daphnia magna]|uniref:Large ribosomal subunit protein bL34m n=1 Tax=Daphnia magna TaxID=35525 RepID=A0A165A8Y6_9CRUS|nr:39S ribosomal protein L34 [Daphnia magna]